VQVAVAEVPEGHHADAGHQPGEQGVGFGDEAGERRDRHRDVVLDVGALVGLRFGDQLAQGPQSARLRR
jgi:hypothetical protein